MIISENYNHYSAIVNASKAAYLSVLIGKGINTIKRYDPTINIKIGEPIPSVINKLKAIRPEAFFYWCEIEQLLTVTDSPVRRNKKASLLTQRQLRAEGLTDLTRTSRGTNWTPTDSVPFPVIIKAIHNWSDRNTKLFKNEYIQIAYDHLDTFYSNSQELF